MTTHDRRFPEWQELYRTHAGEALPWFYPSLDPDVERAIGRLGCAGRALDLGAGSGTQALALAARGFDVTATDVSAAAVDQARARAENAGLPVRCLVDDITETRLEGTFHLVLDRGCFHVLAPERRSVYWRALVRLVEPTGWVLLKCFSDEQPGDVGPYQFSPQELEAQLPPELSVLSIERSIYHGTFEPPPRALFCALTRRR